MIDLSPQNFRPPQYLLTLLILATILQLILRPERVVGPAVMGLLPMAAGFVLVLSALKLFTRHQTPVRHNETPAAVVTTGLYSCTRNPMYLGMELFLLGIGLMIGTWPFLLVPVIMFLILQFLFIPWEEKRMEELFGEKFIKYKKSVRRWL